MNPCNVRTYSTSFILNIFSGMPATAINGEK